MYRATMADSRTNCLTANLVFSVIVVLVGICLTLYEVIVWGMVISYSRSVMPSTGGIGFPKLTICPRTILNASLLNMFNNDVNMKYYGLSMAMPTMSPEVQAAAAQVLSWPMTTLQTVQANYQQYMNSRGMTPVNTLLSYSYQCYGYVVGCWIGGALFDCCMRSTTIFTNVGACNVLDTQQVQLLPGQRGGMSLKFVVDITNALQFAGYTHPGFMIFFDNEQYFMDDPIPVPIGKEVFVDMSLSTRKRMLKPYGEINCVPPYRYFQPMSGTAYGFGFGYSSGYNPSTNCVGMNNGACVDECQRQCIANQINLYCGCFPVGMVSRNFQLSVGAGVMTGFSAGVPGAAAIPGQPGVNPGMGQQFPQQQQLPMNQNNMYTPPPGARYCQVQDNLLCVEPLMNGSNPQSMGGFGGMGMGGGGYGGSTQNSQTNILLACQRQCPLPCVELHPLAATTVIDLHPNYFPDNQRSLIPNQASMVRLYYNSLELGGVEMTAWHWLLYDSVRQIGLTICIWFILGWLLISIAKWITMASTGQCAWKEDVSLKAMQQSFKGRFGGSAKVGVQQTIEAQQIANQNEQQTVQQVA